MADKTSTLILTVDLKCCRCYKKIKKVLSKFCEIQSQSFDEKNNTVTISGPFDPEKLKKELYCKACKCIIDIKIKEKPKTEPKPPPPPAVPVQGIPFTQCVPKVCRRPCCEGGGESEICKPFCPKECCRPPPCYEGPKECCTPTPCCKGDKGRGICKPFCPKKCCKGSGCDGSCNFFVEDNSYSCAIM